MNIIICGAGKVGFSISKQLSAQGHSITVIDQSSEFIQKINDTQDVKGVVGRATYPSVLEKAGAEDAAAAAGGLELGGWTLDEVCIVALAPIQPEPEPETEDAEVTDDCPECIDPVTEGCTGCAASGAEASLLLLTAFGLLRRRRRRDGQTA